MTLKSYILSFIDHHTSFSGLWKCFTILFTASPIPSWICPALGSEKTMNSGWILMWGNWTKLSTPGYHLCPPGRKHFTTAGWLVGGPVKLASSQFGQVGGILAQGKRIQETLRFKSQPYHLQSITLVRCQTSEFEFPQPKSRENTHLMGHWERCMRYYRCKSPGMVPVAKC